MTNPTTAIIIRVENGVVTIDTPEAAINVSAHCPPPGDPAPYECEPNTEWPTDADTTLRFSFIAGNCGTEAVGFGYDSCGYYGSVDQLPDGVSATDQLFYLHYRTDLDRTYVNFGYLPEGLDGRAARVTVTHVASGASQTILGTIHGGEFQEQVNSTMALLDSEVYCVEFAVANGGG